MHAIGLGAALLAVPILISRTWSLGGEASALVGVSVYGATLIGMILCSALYNMKHPDAWSPVLRRLDHAAIYLKIAGFATEWSWTCNNDRSNTSIDGITPAMKLKTAAKIRSRPVKSGGTTRATQRRSMDRQRDEPPRVCRRVSGSRIRLLFRQRSSLHRRPPLLDLRTAVQKSATVAAG
ncbi:hypothetical protein E4191_10470 [Paracoccus liaowanqingii]|uniref:Uncharacterized protein n=1 Tax=Paracoccus liaowanqingii TaxID=2560053 RepID=A0A4P7HPF3_9RHOB|nr:hypothetical protein E4191_10470 [Paracoccus liaowanqingii]